MWSNSKTVKILLTLVMSGTGLASAFASSPPVKFVNPPSTNQTTVIAKVVNFNPPPPPNGPAPGGRERGGAKRGSSSLICPKTNPDFTALAYNSQEKQDIKDVTNVWGYTTSANPSLLFYVPFSQQPSYLTEFILKEDSADNDEIIYETTIPLPEKPGVISWTLPEDAPELKVGQRYRWFFSIYCDPEKMSPPVHVEGVIYRMPISSEVASKLTTATLLEKLEIYAENGFWYDAIATLAELRQQNPQNLFLRENWQSLLSSVNLEDVAKKPILGSTKN